MCVCDCILRRGHLRYASLTEARIKSIVEDPNVSFEGPTGAAVLEALVRGCSSALVPAGMQKATVMHVFITSYCVSVAEHCEPRESIGLLTTGQVSVAVSSSVPRHLPAPSHTSGLVQDSRSSHGAP